MKKTSSFILTLWLTLMFDVYGAVCSTISDGDFNDASIWSCGSVPGKSDDVNINHIVNLNVSFTGGGAIKGDWVIALGASLTSITSDLDISGTGSLTVSGTFEVDNLEFDNGSVVLFNSTANVIVHGDLTNNNNSNSVTVNTTNFTVEGNLENGNGSVIGGSGSIDVDGIVTNNTGGTLFGCTGVGCGCNNCVLLPIELIHFNAVTNGGSVRIEWTTSSEINNDFFTIERSSDGDEWESVSIIKGAGNNNQIRSYLDFDYEPLVGVSYYRLKQTDFDGKSEYFNVVSVKYELEYKTKKINIYPNPINLGGVLSVQLDDETKSNKLITLKNLMGREVYSKEIEVKNSKLLYFSIPSISKGTYLIEIKSNNHQIYHQKLVIN